MGTIPALSGGRRLVASSLLLCCALAASQQPDGPSLGRARELLHELRQERKAAAKSGRAGRFTLDYLNERLDIIERVVNGDLALILRGPRTPSCAELAEDLRRAVSYRGEADSNVGSLLCLHQRQGAQYVAAYALPVGAVYSRSWVGVFASPRPGAPTQLVSSVQNPLPNKTVALAGLPRGPRGQIRFLAYGINWGDPHNRLTVVGYTFGGLRLEQIWSRADLPEGTVKVEGDRIELSFLNMAVGPGVAGVHQVRQVFRVTAAGIRLEGTSTGPNSVGAKPPVGVGHPGRKPGA